MCFVIDMLLIGLLAVGRLALFKPTQISACIVASNGQPSLRLECRVELRNPTYVHCPAG